MTDIVERLRGASWARIQQFGMDDYREAADEIERLRKIEAAVHALRWDDRGLLMAGVDELRDAVGGGQGS